MRMHEIFDYAIGGGALDVIKKQADQQIKAGKVKKQKARISQKKDLLRFLVTLLGK